MHFQCKNKRLSNLNLRYTETLEKQITLCIKCNNLFVNEFSNDYFSQSLIVYVYHIPSALLC